MSTELFYRDCLKSMSREAVVGHIAPDLFEELWMDFDIYGVMIKANLGDIDSL